MQRRRAWAGSRGSPRRRCSRCRKPFKPTFSRADDRATVIRAIALAWHSPTFLDKLEAGPPHADDAALRSALDAAGIDIERESELTIAIADTHDRDDLAVCVARAAV
ncbi:hypothetical protein DF160_29825 [Burkholderia anthina]|nr:hypothetical protein DF160_29825 [Burkholderia anthina]